jgi:ABC-type multidrug transport system fused ATPase/permease subunit
MGYTNTFKTLKAGYGKYKVHFVALAILGMLGALAEGLGISAVVPLLSRLTGEWSTSDVGSSLTRTVLAWFGLGLEFRVILPLIAFAFILKAAIILFSVYLTSFITSHYARDTRSALFTGSLNANWPFLSGQKSGYLETLLIQDVDFSKKLMGSFAKSLTIFSSLIIYLVVSFTISPTITLISLVLGGAIFLFIKPFLYATRELSRSVANTFSEMTHHAGQSLAGAKMIKSALAEKKVIDEGNVYFEGLRKSEVKITLLSQTPVAFIEPISIIFVVGVFSVTYMMGDFKLGVFVGVIYLIHRIFVNIQNLQNVLYRMNERVPYLERIVELNRRMGESQEESGGGEGFRFERELIFKEVAFEYIVHEKILRNLNLSIKRGQMVGIVGRSGAGKTTIVDLILRLITPSSGKILVDDQDVEKIEIGEWRKSIGYVSQDAFLLNDTIENNIKFYSSILSESDIVHGAKMAHVYDFIQSRAQGFKTKVGERGVMLSGGEKQRLVLARILARQPSILILDEATSALDNESELSIQRAVESMRGKITMFVIAHRLSTLLNCDKLVFLEEGMVKEEGKPADLLRDKNSSFYKLYNIRENQ